MDLVTGLAIEEACYAQVCNLIYKNFSVRAYIEKYAEPQLEIDVFSPNNASGMEFFLSL